MARQAKQIAVAPAVDPALDQSKIDGAMAHMRSATAESEQQIAQASQLVGGALMARLHTQFSAAAEIRMFEQLRSLPTEVVRRIPIQQADGSSATAEDVYQLTQLVFGRPYNSMAEAAQNLQALGDETYENACRLGMNRSALRAARALPPEQLKLIQSAISTGSTKAEVLTVIEDLAAKVAEVEGKLDEATAESQAKDQVLSDKNVVIDKLRAAQKRVKALPPDQVLEALLKEVSSALHDARGALIGHFRQGLLALQQHHETNGGDSLVTMAGMVAQLQADLAAVREEFGIPTVDVDAVPEWLKPESEWGKGQTGSN